MKRLAKSVMVAALGVLLISVLILVGCSGPTAPAQKENAADFYKGKNIDFYIMTTAGGGHDAISRIYAEGLAKYSGANVTPINKPGGGFMLAPIYVATTAKPDGLSVAGCEAFSSELAQVLKQEGMEKIDVTQWNWICSMRGMLQIVFVKADSPYNTLGDILKTNNVFKLNAPSLTSNTAIMGMLIIRGLLKKDNFKVYAAVEGGADAIAAVVRGEFTGGALPANRVTAYKDQVKPIMTLGLERDPLFPNVPTIKEALQAANVTTSSDLDYWVDVINGTTKSLTAVMTSPGVPKERVEFLRSAFEKAGNDPDLLARAKKQELGMKWISGTELTEDVKRVVGMSPERAKFLQDAVAAAKNQ